MMFLNFQIPINVTTRKNMKQAEVKFVNPKVAESRIGNEFHGVQLL